jgi:hypothetical protein
MSHAQTVRRGCTGLVAAVLLTGMAGCGSNSADVGTGGPTGSPSPTGPADLVPSKPPTTADGEVRLQGTVGVGVEAGCLVLINASGTYTLLGGKVTAAQVGQDVVVTGTVARDKASTCQQGTLLDVTQVLTR